MTAVWLYVFGVADCSVAQRLTVDEMRGNCQHLLDFGADAEVAVRAQRFLELTDVRNWQYLDNSGQSRVLQDAFAEVVERNGQSHVKFKRRYTIPIERLVDKDQQALQEIITLRSEIMNDVSRAQRTWSQPQQMWPHPQQTWPQSVQQSSVQPTQQGPQPWSVQRPPLFPIPVASSSSGQPPISFTIWGNPAGFFILFGIFFAIHTAITQTMKRQHQRPRVSTAQPTRPHHVGGKGLVYQLIVDVIGAVIVNAIGLLV
jgi:hypothetical protein